MKHTQKIAIQGSLALVCMVLTLLATKSIDVRAQTGTGTDYKVCIATVLQNRESANVATYRTYFDAVVLAKEIYTDALYDVLLIEDSTIRSAELDRMRQEQAESIETAKVTAGFQMRANTATAKAEADACKTIYNGGGGSSASSSQNSSQESSSSSDAFSSSAQSSSSSFSEEVIYPSSSAQSSSNQSSVVAPKVYPWTRDREDDAQESNFLAGVQGVIWGNRCNSSSPGTDCIRYVYSTVNGTRATIRVRLEDIKNSNLSQKDYNYVAAVLWHFNKETGNWSNVTSIRHDQYWGNSPHPIYAKSLSVVPGEHLYKIVLTRGRVNLYGIPITTDIVDEVQFNINVPLPDPAVKLENVTTEYTGKGTINEQIRYRGTITGYKNGIHQGYINWGRGLKPFQTSVQDGLFDFTVSNRGYNPGGETFLAYCPTWLIVGTPGPYAQDPTNRTIYDSIKVCPLKP